MVAHEGMRWKQALARSIELLRMVKITDPRLRIRSYPHELSGGMRQRASSAASLGPHPDLLIADEPTTALDVTTQRQYLDLLKELQKATGMAIIFITHDISIVGNLCDKLAVFYGGLVVEYGPKDQVLNHPSHPYTEALLQALPTLGERRTACEQFRVNLLTPVNCPSLAPFIHVVSMRWTLVKKGSRRPRLNLATTIEPGAGC